MAAAGIDRLLPPPSTVQASAAWATGADGPIASAGAAGRFARRFTGAEAAARSTPYRDDARDMERR